MAYPTPKIINYVITKRGKGRFKKFAIDAARLYDERKDVHRKTGSVKGSTDEEAGKSTKRPVLNLDLIKPIKFTERTIEGNDLKNFHPMQSPSGQGSR